MTEFTREDVVRHLADLGYDNVEEAKLDSFCADLRKLIKYEEKKRRVGEKLELLEQSQRRLQEDTKGSSSTPEVARRKRRVRREDKKRAKEEKLKAKYGESCQDSTSSSHLIMDRDGLSSSIREVETSSEREEVDYNMTGHGVSVSSEADQNDPSSLYIDVDLPPSQPSSSSLPLAASLLSHPPPGFIRVRSAPSVGRKGPASDPVALHQRYRE